ncbi:MAG: hypothetical protein CL489_06295 [Acidobacteria bacterium]|nr:hypothetical protein [Acidobacteriota bacterium]|tara:strand:- start:41516 stop:41710 length:195 start_codon:yes stop_codon:yes gene_type:complete
MIELTETEYTEMSMEGGHGFCRKCEEPADDYCEPDARNYHCTSCGEDEVFGLEELLMMGEIEIR